MDFGIAGKSALVREGVNVLIVARGAICALLCSLQAGYINGQNLLADGGAYAGVF